ncbi:protein adenylyltransferase SelO [Actinomycetospora termitidis]|uniref:Protein nucleotidyltransferase YdiU n=1 Tax=Actinomycetospora termitidis TaxID=3053470 RepID=A0ABT7MEV5_9PSEU|nr:YdiU family protein [Actinomycetospora sp. Odt1-22]MDL5158714.1 YdiU family protein [Actinomycetospora sp. Odt1-22]
MSTAVSQLEHTYADAVPDLVLNWSAAPVRNPSALVVNDELAAELGLDPRELVGSGLLTGTVPEGVQPVAMAYSGHQFGMYQPRLGDGRALLLGEIVDPQGHRHDLHLKGSGRTRFARGGDGRAALGPMLREYLMGEAMHALGIPTSRGLAVSTTGEDVPRDTGLLPGAVLARVASSHIRVGTFQYAAATGGPDLVRALTDHAIARHHPEATDVLDFYRRVVHAQAALIAQWMLVGFVHGVMNTDNTTISGETIDYGPCAFMDRYDPQTVFSSIDHAGRYAYGNQPPIARWNLARLGEALLPLIDEDSDTAIEKATAVVQEFGEVYERHFQAGMAAKLGLREPDPDLVADLLALLHAQQVDWTGFFRAGTPRDLFLDRDAYDAWAARWHPELDRDHANPLYVPRNHLVDEALTAAEQGDLAPFLEILEVVSAPYTEQPGRERYTEPGSGPFVTYCGT